LDKKEVVTLWKKSTGTGNNMWKFTPLWGSCCSCECRNRRYAWNKWFQGRKIRYVS